MGYPHTPGAVRHEQPKILYLNYNVRCLLPSVRIAGVFMLFLIYMTMWLLALDDVAVLFLAEGFETEGVVRVVEVGGGVDGLAVDARLEV